MFLPNWLRFASHLGLEINDTNLRSNILQAGRTVAASLPWSLLRGNVSANLHDLADSCRSCRSSWGAIGMEDLATSRMGPPNS